ncbi:uncharacterized protein EV420DRAFT_1538806 [Desarmillaria tabescens]|uniref:Secreted protein n=1 Tax=Armillaria tabescens TaxID=1929756 RepID=A0AA39KHW1_ARMTA|nr:uncharacterized protein EV420DRAFT_1538806 [Desarmillaria tabescens]KAK0459193.1 hypothetical protein EV420DRAFT_1538806 [Desarmillaria tabescens]
MSMTIARFLTSISMTLYCSMSCCPSPSIISRSFFWVAFIHVVLCHDTWEWSKHCLKSASVVGCPNFNLPIYQVGVA